MTEREFEISSQRVWRRTDVLRTIVPEGTTSDAPKLQQMWVEQNTGERQWRGVERVVVSNAEFFAA